MGFKRKPILISLGGDALYETDCSTAAGSIEPAKQARFKYYPEVS